MMLAPLPDITVRLWQTVVVEMGPSARSWWHAAVARVPSAPLATQAALWFGGATAEDGAALATGMLVWHSPALVGWWERSTPAARSGFANAMVPRVIPAWVAPVVAGLIPAPEGAAAWLEGLPWKRETTLPVSVPYDRGELARRVRHLGALRALHPEPMTADGELLWPRPPAGDRQRAVRDALVGMGGAGQGAPGAGVITRTPPLVQRRGVSSRTGQGGSGVSPDVTAEAATGQATAPATDVLASEALSSEALASGAVSCQEEYAQAVLWGWTPSWEPRMPVLGRGIVELGALVGAFSDDGTNTFGDLGVSRWMSASPQPAHVVWLPVLRWLMAEVAPDHAAPDQAANDQADRAQATRQQQEKRLAAWEAWWARATPSLRDSFWLTVTTPGLTLMPGDPPLLSRLGWSPREGLPTRPTPLARWIFKAMHVSTSAGPQEAWSRLTHGLPTWIAWRAAHPPRGRVVNGLTAALWDPTAQWPHLQEELLQGHMDPTLQAYLASTLARQWATGYVGRLGGPFEHIGHALPAVAAMALEQATGANGRQCSAWQPAWPNDESRSEPESD
jgi:hypothetical protein